jgi:hypothetical protein
LLLATVLAAATFAACSMRDGAESSRGDTQPTGVESESLSGLPRGGNGAGGIGSKVGGLLPGSRRPNVLTQHNDNARSGWNPLEPDLTPEVVQGGGFRKVARWAVTGQVYAQPLYVSEAIGGADALVVATEDNFVYAIDAQADSITPFWKRQLGQPIEVCAWEPHRNCDESTTLKPCANNMRPHMGVTGTPVIDPDTRIIYLVAAETHLSRLPSPNGDGRPLESIGFTLHALSLDDGTDVVPPRPIRPKAADSQGHPLVWHDDMMLQRAALLLSGEDVVVTFASNHSDFEHPHDPSSETRAADYLYWGWVLGFDRKTLAPTRTFVTAPDDSQAGVWQGANGPAADRSGHVFVESGNNLTADAPGYGDSLVELAPFVARPRPTGLPFDGPGTAGTPAYRLVSFFTPQHADDWVGTKDVDFGSSGPVVLPGERIVLAGGKSGVLYPRPIGKLGGRSVDDAALDPAPIPLRSLSPTAAQIIASPVYWRGPDGLRVFVWPENGGLISLPVVDGVPVGDPSRGALAAPVGTDVMHVPTHWGAPLALSSWGRRGGLLWANIPWSETSSVLAAFDPADLHALWSSDALDADAVGGGARMMAPTVAGGRVFLGTYAPSPDVCPGSPDSAAGWIEVYGVTNPDGGVSADAGEADGTVPADAETEAAIACFGGGAAPSDWPTVYADLFGPGSKGHCFTCHTPDGGAGGLRIGDSSPQATYCAFTTEPTILGVLVTPGSAASGSVLGNPVLTPLSWYGPPPPAAPRGNMPWLDAHYDRCAAAEVTAWLGAGAPNVPGAPACPAPGQ